MFEMGPSSYNRNFIVEIGISADKRQQIPQIPFGFQFK